MIAYFNGEYLPKESITISPDDRGFLFADGLYEVIRAYDGKLFCAKQHIERLNRGARHLCLEKPAFGFLETVSQTLIGKNNLTNDATVYIQVTRGAAPRKHGFPTGIQPTVYAFAAPFDPAKSKPNQENGVQAITVEDIRWSRCDLKTVGLTANVLAKQQALEQNATEALFVRDQMLLEGSHSNFMAVVDEALVTAPATNTILHGITRQTVLDLAREKGIEIKERPIPVKDIQTLSEAFITGTTTEITPVITIDQQKIGSATPGPVTRILQKAFREMVRPGN